VAVPTQPGEIHIRLLNAHNGKPITNEDVNVSLDPWHSGDLIAPTNKDGVVVLHLAGNAVTADAVSPSSCDRTATLGPTRAEKQ
jgi:hypothetical protein